MNELVVAVYVHGQFLLCPSWCCQCCRFTERRGRHGKMQRWMLLLLLLHNAIVDRSARPVHHLVLALSTLLFL